MSMIRSSRCSAVVLASLLVCAACDDDESDAAMNGPSATASVDVATAQLALDELASNVDITVTGFGGASAAPAIPSTPMAGAAAVPANAGTINVRCSAGGDASIGGYVNIVPIPVDVDVKVAIAYDGCVTSTGTALTGTIDFSQSVAAGPGTPLRIETLYRGDVAFSGKVNARCPVDLNVLVDEQGSAIEVGGTFCGRDASALSLHISPRWSSR